MPITARGTTTIARPIEDVFDFLSDARNEPQWLPGAESVELTSSEPVDLGSTFVGRYAGAGRVELELVEFERPYRVTFRAHSKIVDFDDVVELFEGAEGTRLDATLTAKPLGAMRLAGPLMGRTLRRRFEANWDHLRQALEATAP